MVSKKQIELRLKWMKGVDLKCTPLHGRPNLPRAGMQNLGGNNYKILVSK